VSWGFFIGVLEIIDRCPGDIVKIYMASHCEEHIVGNPATSPYYLRITG